MPHSLPSAPPRHSRGGHVPLYAGLAVALVFFAASGYSAYRNTQSLREGSREVARTHDVIASLKSVLSLIKDAETGQRGYVITGDETYLDPFNSARAGLDAEMARMKELSSERPDQKSQVSQVEALTEAKFAEMAETITLRREQGFDAAREIVATDRGRSTMDAIRESIGNLERDESRVRQVRIAAMEASHRVAVASGIVTGVLGVFLSCAVAYLVRRAAEARKREEWLRNGKLELTVAMAGERGVEPLAESILAFLTKYVDAHAGALFVERTGHFQRVAMVGVPLGSGVPEQFGPGDGLLGQAVTGKSLRRIDEVPEGYLTVGSALGQGRPRQLLVLPAATDGMVNAVLELGFLHPLSARCQEFVQQIAEPVAVAVRSALYRENLQSLLIETQQQSEELQAQSEELRVSNEELEEQGRALRESQSRLELQQVEMEQTNAQLEEQAQVLEHQKDELSRSKDALESQARLVEKASRYKSDFLANMSHELRTPLNSSLILAKLLGENRSGNLTAEQVKYANTIESAGNDLLALINDVLDLSKIEAGHLSIHAEPVGIAGLVADLKAGFEPVAAQRSLELTMEIEADVPETVETDSHRLLQVMKNLLSNALKFTEKGKVGLRVGRGDRGRIAFTVEDTGIGIDPAQQRIIFEPFQQADGTTDRKYGGTGLGLSISRELIRLLGGEIRLTSELGKGSAFTVLIPASGRGMNVRPAPAFAAQLAPPETPPPMPVAAADFPAVSGGVPDGRRLILVVEDDETFARIVADLAEETGFRCLVAANAEEGLALARQHQPGAVVLDVGLPDNSGLFVLDQLKGDARTRHIPVHVVSGNDYAKTAMALGAVGYMLKPVRREQLVEAFGNLEARLTRKMRRVLVVEDDPVQADAMQQLLGSSEVETVAVATAAECLEMLKSSTFDCMVLDLSLPDASGFSLLETLSKEDIYSFPPVIVYTGRVLDEKEEQRLRRYSKSIIIKGAKSPDRLLDEVSLFLHQVVAELPPEQQRMVERAPNRDAALEGRHILVAEDDVRNIFALTSLLEGRGVKLQIARNGREAIELLERNSPPVDLVLMDIMMPEMDGFSAIREIRSRPTWKKLPIIALTAKAMKDDQDQCLAAGASDYLAKPLDVEKLLSLIRVWMPR